MRHPRRWIGLGLTLALLGIVLVALPPVVRRVAIDRIEALTGRKATIADVDLNLFTRRFEIEGLTVAGAAGEAEPLARVRRVGVRFRLWPLLTGHVHVDAMTLEEPVLHLERYSAGDSNIGPVLARMARGGDFPFALTLDLLVVRGGTVVLDDHAARTPVVWAARGLTAELRSLTTVADAVHGSASVRFELARGQVTIEAHDLRVRPVHARVTIDASGLDLAPLWSYLPPEASFRPDGGTLAVHVDAAYNLADGARAAGRGAITGLVIRLGGAERWLDVPATSLVSRDLVYRDGGLRVGHLELSTATTLVDDSGPSPERYAIPDLRVAVEALHYPYGSPARVHASAILPGGATVDGPGTLGFAPLTLATKPTVKGLDLALTRLLWPKDAAVAPRAGRVDAALDVGYDARQGLRASGTATVSGLSLGAPDQSRSLFEAPGLRADMTGLTWRGGALDLARLTLTGSAAVSVRGEPARTVALDRFTLTTALEGLVREGPGLRVASVALRGTAAVRDTGLSPAPRFDLTALGLLAERVSWPSTAPASVRAFAETGRGGVLALDGTFDPGTFTTDVHVTAANLDASRWTAYLPPGAAVRVLDGRLALDTRLTRRRGQGIQASGRAAVEDLALERSAGSGPFLRTHRLTLQVFRIGVVNGVTTAKDVTLSGAATLIPEGANASPVAIEGFHAALERAEWPPARPWPLRFSARDADRGRLTADGTADPTTRSLTASVRFQDVALDCVSGLLPLRGPVRGHADATLRVEAHLDGGVRGRVEGTGTITALQIGPRGRSVATADRIEATGLRVEWPSAIAIDQLVVTRPWALLERKRDGAMPLREMLALRVTAEGGNGALAAPTSRPAIRIGRLRVEDADLRFLDRTTTPAYSEEASELTITLTHVSNAPAALVPLTVQGVLGGKAALTLHGVVAPFATPFVLEVDGELNDFSAPRTNPYVQKFLDWFVEKGSLTTRVDYRIVGDRLKATNDLVLKDFAVRRDRDAADADHRLGLPLDLAVSLLKRPGGDIHLTVPVTGTLSAPDFSFGHAFAQALKNVATRVISAPFLAIGRVLHGGPEDRQVVAVEINPVTFEPGAAVVRAEARKQLQRVADFLRASPYVDLSIQPIVSTDDLARLKERMVARQIQTLQAEHGLTFEDAARMLYRRRHPDRDVPPAARDVVAALAADEPTPAAAAARLAQRRLEAARRTLAAGAGIEAARLQAGATTLGDAGRGRVEFQLVAD
jgi:hypothetical protein